MEPKQIYQELKEFRLTGMAECWDQMVQTGTAASVSLQNGLEMMLQSERDTRKANRTKRLIRGAKFRYSNAFLDDFTFDSARGRDRTRIIQLATCDFIRKGQSVTITGPAGVGKSYMATMLGHQACEAGYSVMYLNMQKLLENVRELRMEGRVAKYFEKVADTDLVIIEDFGFSVLDGQQLLDFMELIEDRHGRKSTIITSQLPVKDWYAVLKKNATIADAIIDRIAKTAIHFDLSGDSMRK